MRYFAVLLFLLTTSFVVAQNNKVKGVVLNEQTNFPENGASIINLSTLNATRTNNNGAFSINANLNDTLHFSVEGYRSLKIRVTADWLQNDQNVVYMKDNSIVLDELVISNLNLTGILSVDTKLIAIAEYPYFKDFGPTGFNLNYNSGLNPINGIYNSIKRNSNESKKINQVKQEVALIEIMKDKFDRETVSALLNISKEDIVSILQRCNHSERFIYTANDYQIFNAVNECYTNYNLSK